MINGKTKVLKATNMNLRDKMVTKKRAQSYQHSNFVSLTRPVPKM